MLNIVICDDSEIICKYLSEKLQEYFKQVYKDINIEIFTSSNEFFKYNNINNIDLIFLDIEIDEKSGIDIAKNFQDSNTSIVFISAYKDYALDLFKLRPLDFLVKPIKIEKLNDVLNRFVKTLDEKSYCFKYKIKNNIFFEDINNILFFESMGRKIKIVTKENENIFYGNLKNINQELYKFNFIQTHNSFLVNKKYIIKITNTELFIKYNLRVPISRSNKDSILKLYMRG